ncbi:hypothetical protein [Nonomuraea sp. NPDC049695]|uniref:hypothetical protein n=1 Tax=Nonomuraea sp. NPDC049695 TaxID=3154734 RepID=UPI003417419A
MATYVKNQPEPTVKGRWWRDPLSWIGRGRRLEEALRAAEEARQAAESAAQEAHARQQQALEALVKSAAGSLDESMREQADKVLAAVEALKQPSPPSEDVHIGRLYRLYLCSGQRGDIHRFIRWMQQSEEHRRWVPLAIQALFEGEEARQRQAQPGRRKSKALLSPKKRNEYEALLAQDGTVQEQTDLVA